jgi:hypothetical protein
MGMLIFYVGCPKFIKWVYMSIQQHFIVFETTGWILIKFDADIQVG